MCTGILLPRHDGTRARGQPTCQAALFYAARKKLSSKEATMSDVATHADGIILPYVALAHTARDSAEL